MRRLALGILCVFAIGCGTNDTPTEPAQTMTTEHYQAVTVPILNELGLGIEAGTYWFAPFTIPVGAADASVDVDFTVVSGRDVEVYLLDSRAATNWERGTDGATPIWASGRVATAKESWRLGAGDYVVIVSNRYSWFTSKIVRVAAAARYTVTVVQ